MIITKLQGGLGNQMFQYAVGRYLAIKNNTALKLDTTFFSSSPNRELKLDKFNIQTEIATPREIEFLKPDTFFFKFKKHFFPFLLSGYGLETSRRFLPNILNLKNGSYLDGDWQSEKYFKDIEETIRKEFTLKKPWGSEAAQAAEIIDETNSISIHVRRGDYAENSKIQAVHGLTPLEYYSKAMQQLETSISDATYFVFSDDIVWAKNNLKFNTRSVFISHENIKDYEELVLMGLCKHHITANSSFSWWGAWLGSYPQKIVISPKKWFADPSKDTRDLTPPSWILL